MSYITDGRENLQNSDEKLTIDAKFTRWFEELQQAGVHAHVSLDATLGNMHSVHIGGKAMEELFKGRINIGNSQTDKKEQLDAVNAAIMRAQQTTQNVGATASRIEQNTRQVVPAASEADSSLMRAMYSTVPKDADGNLIMTDTKPLLDADEALKIALDLAEPGKKLNPSVEEIAGN